MDRTMMNDTEAEFQLLNTTDFVTTLEKEAIINFLLPNMGVYEDTRDNISRAIEYALSKFPHQGGFVLQAKKNEELIGVSVVNRTNFEGYFAENILVYMAVHPEHRGQGIARQLIEQSKVYSKGDIMVRLKSDQDARMFNGHDFNFLASEFVFRR